MQPVSYDVVPGDLTAQIMGGFTAAGTMAFSLANILLPEVRSRCSAVVPTVAHMQTRHGKPDVQAAQKG